MGGVEYRRAYAKDANHFIVVAMMRDVCYVIAF